MGISTNVSVAVDSGHGIRKVVDRMTGEGATQDIFQSPGAAPLIAVCRRSENSTRYGPRADALKPERRGVHP